ncbi:MMPL family protein [Mycobacterium xenopi 4042]|uniref:MMPL family protein n=1 Tax=Mycobacterium xenopi 4042 TaxID=1299334 RepID=X7ZNR0_MYCXE|nr:MMPL family protein [Mycobacterium xenopi 4042]
MFAFTMLAMLTSDLRTIGQVGSTVCIGLLLDTLIVRSFVVPCILRILDHGSGGRHWCVPARYPSDESVTEASAQQTSVRHRRYSAPRHNPWQTFTPSCRGCDGSAALFSAVSNT